MRKLSFLALISLLVFDLAGAWADDWPQFRGPRRDGKSSETNLLKKWPPSGPPLLWTFKGLGRGFSSVAVAGGRIYTTGMLDKKGVLFALDLKGRLLWKKIYGPEWNGSMPGVRATPTVAGPRLYLMSGRGVVYCFYAGSGAEIDLAGRCLPAVPRG